MKKLFNFKQIKLICAFVNADYDITNKDCAHPVINNSKDCCAKNCPVWKKGEECKTTK